MAINEQADATSKAPVLVYFFDQWNWRGMMQTNAQEAAIATNHMTQVLVK